MAELREGKLKNTSGQPYKYYTGNVFLSRAQMQVNARYVWQYLRLKGWSRNAVAGMLGNMETESTINAGIWQNLSDGSDLSLGFGLVQWTPASKYLDWCGYVAYDSIDTALDRIIYELENGLQWISTEDYPLSFATFAKSAGSPEYLAECFLHNYERPADTNQPARATQARTWYNYLEQYDDGYTGDGGDIDDGDEPTPIPYKTSKMPLWLLIAATRRN